MTDITLSRTAPSLSSLFRQAVTNWTEWRAEARRQRAVDAVAQSLDAHLRDDIGLMAEYTAISGERTDRSVPSWDIAKDVTRQMGPSPWWSGGDPRVDLRLRELEAGLRRGV